MKDSGEILNKSFRTFMILFEVDEDVDILEILPGEMLSNLPPSRQKVS